MARSEGLFLYGGRVPRTPPPFIVKNLNEVLKGSLLGTIVIETLSYNNQNLSKGVL